MKNRSSFSTVLMVSVSLIALTACEEPQVDASIFENLAQCKRDPVLSSNECESSFKEARSQHAAVAPKYASQAECQADYGEAKCEQAPYRTAGGGSVFMPMMMGYMMGSMLGGRRSMMSQPLYQSAKSPNAFRTADNRNVGSTIGRTQVASSAASRPSVKSSTRSRGGFGSSGGRFGSAAT
ncbi:MAG: hypothetical protein CMM25_07535 [Rhodospirillaceae bacterium]|nr:hypothetical protein [Rhodospirillaceae bacterium]|tara:strand:- start:723 stop:1265 length:543 start_codon:yes stop_codon:yes gene_type:complete